MTTMSMLRYPGLNPGSAETSLRRNDEKFLPCQPVLFDMPADQIRMLRTEMPEACFGFALGKEVPNVLAIGVQRIGSTEIPGIDPSVILRIRDHLVVGSSQTVDQFCDRLRDDVRVTSDPNSTKFEGFSDVAHSVDREARECHRSIDASSGRKVRPKSRLSMGKAVAA